MTDADQDERFRQMLEKFARRLMTVHGLSRAEAQMGTQGELQRAYDEQRSCADRNSRCFVETISTSAVRSLFPLVIGLGGLQDSSLAESKPKSKP